MSRSSSTIALLVAFVLYGAGVGLLIWDGIDSLRVTDAEIAGGPPEDTLGFFGPYLLIVISLLPGLAGLSLAWSVTENKKRRLVTLVGCGFLAVSVAFNAWAFNLLSHRVFK